MTTAAELPVPESTSPLPQKQGGRRTIIGLLLSILAGLMFMLATPIVSGWWFLAPLGVIPMIIAQFRFLPRRICGLAMGITWYIMWFGVFYYGTRQLAGPLVGPLLAIIPLVIGTVLGSFDRKFNERTNYRFFLLTMPAIWTAWEFLISQNMLNATEGQVQYSMAPVPVLIQPISLLGAPALAFVMLMFGASLGLAALRWFDRRTTPIDSVPVPQDVFTRVFIWGVSLTLLWVVVSVGLFFHTRSEFGPTARMAAIQLGTGTGFSADGTGKFGIETKRRYTELSEQAAAAGAKYLVWPEAGLDFDPRVTDPTWIPGLAKRSGAYIQAAWFYQDSDGTQHNQAGLWGPDGSFVGVYDKIHPIAIDGEFFNQPVAYPVFQTSLGPISMIICFDFTFYDTTRNMVTNGAKIMAASTGDWTDVGPSRIGTVQFRAIENGVGFAKDELLSGSAMINPDGTILAESVPAGDQGESTFVIADVAQGPGNTVYNAIGDVFGYMLLMGLVARVYYQIKYWRRARKAST